MENKKTFGAYILRRRKELGMTQKEFAGKLFVTESAVSKWERGLSYPDITLLTTICSVLDITEHELLTGSEDTGRRTSETLAAKYLRLTRNYRISQYILYGLVLLGCAIGNLASAHTLDWFLIVVAGVMMAASLTLVPALAALSLKLGGYKKSIAFGCFLVSLELLLLICCIYTGGDWFVVAGTAVLFGLSLVALPFIPASLPLPACMAKRKVSVYLVTETVLLLVLLLVCCIYTGGDWFVTAAVSVVFGLGFFVLPVVLWQSPLPSPVCRHKTLLYFFIQTVLLFAVITAAELGSGGHIKTLLTMEFPYALAGLVLPWGIMTAVRYLPVNGWFRAAVSVAWTDLWIWLAPLVMDWIMICNYGPVSHPYTLLMTFDFRGWGTFTLDGQSITANNVIVIILVSLLAVSVLLAAVGVSREKKKRKS